MGGDPIGDQGVSEVNPLGDMAQTIPFACQWSVRISCWSVRLASTVETFLPPNWVENR